jgi:hypothetical protein
MFAFVLSVVICALAPGCGREQERVAAPGRVAVAPGSQAPARSQQAGSSAAIAALATTGGRQVDPARARTVAIRWLLALKQKQLDALESLTLIPFEATGYDIGGGPERPSCGKDTGVDMQMSFTVQDQAGLRKLSDCLALDAFLRSATPELAVTDWPSAAPPGVELESRGRPSGYADPLKLDSLPNRLERYRTELQTLSANSALVGFFITDGNGISIAGALAVKAEGRADKVSHLLLDEKFEE